MEIFFWRNLRFSLWISHFALIHKRCFFGVRHSRQLVLFWVVNFFKSLFCQSWELVVSLLVSPLKIIFFLACPQDFLLISNFYHFIIIWPYVCFPLLFLWDWLYFSDCGLVFLVEMENSAMIISAIISFPIISLIFWNFH